MAIAFLLDEQLRGPLWQAVRTHNARGVFPIDAVRVGDPTDLSLGTKDPEILLWAEREVRTVVSLDESTMKTHLADHLRAGRNSPGVFLVRKGSSFLDVVEFLVAAAYASEAVEWQDKFTYIP